MGLFDYDDVFAMCRQIDNSFSILQNIDGKGEEIQRLKKEIKEWKDRYKKLLDQRTRLGG